MKKEEAWLQQAVSAKVNIIPVRRRPMVCSTVLRLKNEAMEEKLNTAEQISLWSEMKFFTLPPQYHSLGWMTQNNRAERRALCSVQAKGKYHHCWKLLQWILKARGALSAGDFPTISATWRRTVSFNSPKASNKSKVLETVGHLNKFSDLEILPDLEKGMFDSAWLRKVLFF